MLVVPTFLDKSPIHGFGVFAKDPIKKGTVLWAFNPKFDIVFSEAEFEALPASARAELEIHLYQPEPGGDLYYESTMGKYMNHSRDPNVDFSNIGKGIATRDIKAGEELLCDYRHFMGDVSHIDYL
jgi:SET domain-containing protein